MAHSKIHSSIIPTATVKGNTLTVWYEVKPNNEKKHLRMHEDEIAYIHHWISRFVMDVSQKQFLDKNLYQMCTIPSKEMPKSTYAGSYNSVLSYASGIVGNKLRNPSEDYTKKQLRYIKKLFDIILKFQQKMQELHHSLLLHLFCQLVILEEVQIVLLL